MKLVLILFISSLTLTTLAQTDTIIAYDVRTKTIETILPVEFDESINFDSTPSYEGTYENTITLPSSTPQNNLYENASFTRLEPANHFFDLNTYPIRTAMRMFRHKNDSLKGCCSGILVSENMVLIAAHCIYSHNYEKDENGNWRKNNVWASDSIFISPAFDNASNQKLLPNSFVRKYYIPKIYYDHPSDDIALLELNEPIGKQLGWIGMAFSTDTNFYKNKVFHKLSYPGTINFFDSTEVYNGDTLYYNYGLIDPVLYGNSSNRSLYVKNVTSIGGQSGSSLFYEDESQYYSVGVLNYSSNSLHQRITNDIFYQFKHIITNNKSTEIKQNRSSSLDKTYPNPWSVFAVIEFENPDQLQCTLEIFNSSGQKVRSQNINNKQSVRIERNNFQPGLYFYKIHSSRISISTGRFIIID
ncbi:MAG: T9SS type A sorting domain-containing protein [Prolixibacteraceae bacterium]|jgi:hypothetical protein|nr:T9SS type A sorting domain-containing protein [Prolixibacteraceae bacterium]